MIYLFATLLTVVYGYAYRSWLQLHTLMHGDTPWMSPYLLKEIFQSRQAWSSITQTGQPEITLFASPVLYVWSALYTHIHIDNVYLLVLTLPQILSFIFSIFYYARRNSFLKISAYLIYATFPYILLRQTAHLQIAVVYLLAPLVIELTCAFIEKPTYSRGLACALLYTICCLYEFRIALLLGICICILLLPHFNKILKLPSTYIAIFAVVFLNLYWILPTFIGSFSSIQQVISRDLFGDQLFNIGRAFTLSEAAWTGSYPNQRFAPQPILPHLWMIPILMFVGLVYAQKRPITKEFWLYSIIWCIGLFLSKQSGPPFTGVYEFLYKHIPGFNLYREASKWYFLVAIGYFGMFTHLSSIFSKKTYQTLFVYSTVCACFIAFINIKPLITQEIGTTFVPRQRPTGYQKFEDIYIHDRDYYRILSIPTNTSWITFTSQHPLVSLENITEIDSNINLLHKKYVNEFLNFLYTHTIRYIVVPDQDNVNDNNIFNWYQPQSTYLAYLDTIPQLKKIGNFSNVHVYENTQYLPHVDKVISYTRVHPAHYIFRVNVPGEVTFQESFHPQWKLFPAHTFNIWLAPWQKSIADDTHQKIYGYANRWRIDVPGDYVLYYVPQTYFFIGIYISLMTLVSISIFLIYLHFHRRQFFYKQG